jgi:hypothetical protein
MQISIGNIKASCARCNCSQFQPLAQSEPQATDLFACEQCKAQWTRGELLLQIGDEAVHRARQFRETLRKTRGSQPPVPTLPHRRTS